MCRFHSTDFFFLFSPFALIPPFTFSDWVGFRSGWTSSNPSAGFAVRGQLGGVSDVHGQENLLFRLPPITDYAHGVAFCIGRSVDLEVKRYPGVLHVLELR